MIISTNNDMPEKTGETALTEKDGEYRLVKSPVPGVAAGLFWLIYSLALPLYTWYHILIAAALSVVVYWISGQIFPAKQVFIPKKKKAEKHHIELSGDKEVDVLIKEARGSVRRIEEDAGIIERDNPRLARDTRELVDSGCRILDYVAKHPESAKLVRRFFSYYIPTLEKLLDSYIEFTRHGIAAETVEDIDEVVPRMKEVFAKMIDKLFSDRELDISSDIAVLENKLDSIEGMASAHKE